MTNLPVTVLGGSVCSKTHRPWRHSTKGGAGNAFIDRIDPEGFDFFSPRGYDKIYREGKKYTRVALTQKLRRIVDESVGYGLALEGISAADVARSQNR